MRAGIQQCHMLEGADRRDTTGFMGGDNGGQEVQGDRVVPDEQTRLAGVPAGEAPTPTAPGKRDRSTEIGVEIAQISKEIADTVERISTLNGTELSYGLMTGIDGDTVDDAFDVLRTKPLGRSMTVVVHSPGGDIHSAYNLACLFQRYAADRLVFVVPGWAKSAATLLVCGGDTILMTPVAELGPLDPQLTVYDGQEGRHEHFSPLHIESTLELIRQEFDEGQRELAEALVKRLQFPMTLGSYKKLLDVGQDYSRRLLESRMFRPKKGVDSQADMIAKRLVGGYPDHGCCIHSEEANAMGMRVEVPTGPKLDAIWSINGLIRRKDKLEDERKKLDMMKAIRNLPPELLDRLPTLPDELDGMGGRSRTGERRE